MVMGLFILLILFITTLSTMTLTEFYEHQSPQINQIKEYGEEIFGEGNIDIQTESSFYDGYSNYNLSYEEWENLDKNCYCVYIYFPEKTVVNELGNSHKIYDGYVRFFIKTNMRLFDSIKYTRSRMTIKELYYSYVFSHCFGFDISELRRLSNESPSADFFRRLCFGTGPIVTSISRLLNNSTEENWKIFFNDLDTYFNIESIEGGPYVRLETLNGKEYKHILKSEFCEIPILSHKANNLLFEFIDYLKITGWFDSIKYTLYGNVPVIESSYTSLYEDLCDKFNTFKTTIENSEDYDEDTKKILESFTIKYTSIKEPNSIIVTEEYKISNINLPTFPIDMNFKFNGEPVKFNIKEDDEDNNINTHNGFSILIFNRLLNSITRCILFYSDNNGDTIFL